MKWAPRDAAVLAIVALMGATLLAASARGKTQSFVGTLERVDGTTLVVQTRTGQETVVLAPKTQIRHGSKTLAAADLPFEAGARVKVRFTTEGGRKEAQSVMVSTVRTTARAGDVVGTTATSQTSSKKP